MSRRGVWWAGLVAGAALLLAAGHGRLAVPAPWQPAAFLARLRADGAVVAAVAVLRVAMLAAGAYLVALSALAELGRLPALSPLVRRLLRVPLPGTRLVLRSVGLPIAVLGATLAASGTAGAQPAGGPPTLAWFGRAGPSATGVPGGVGAGPGAGDAPVLRWLPNVPLPLSSGPATASSGPPPSTSPPSTSPPPAGITLPVRPGPPATPAPVSAPAPATPRRHNAPPGRARRPAASMPAATLPPAATGITQRGTATAPSAPAPRTPTAPSGLPAAGPGLPTYTLAPGDHLWKVAEFTLAASLGPRPDEQRLGSYWWQLVEANRSRLPDPANPDFVVPGMVVILPLTGS